MNTTDPTMLVKELQSYADQMTAIRSALEPFLGSHAKRRLDIVASKDGVWDRRQVIDEATKGLGVPTNVLYELADALGSARNSIAHNRVTLRTASNDQGMFDKMYDETRMFFKSTLNAWRDRHGVRLDLRRKYQSTDITARASQPIPLPVYQYQRLKKVLPKIIYRWRPFEEVPHATYMSDVMWRSLPVLHNPFNGRDLDRGAFFYDATFWKQEGGYNLFRAKAVYPKPSGYYSEHEVRSGIIASTADTEFVVSAFKPQEEEDDYDHVVAEQAVKLVRRRTADFINRRLLDEPLFELHNVEVPPQ